MPGASRRRVLAGGTIERRAEIGRERREKTRELLLTAAARIVAARGTDGVMIDDFIKAAGVARGTFYNYFKTREQLIAALWERFGNTPVRTIRTATAADKDPAYRLAAGLRMAVHNAARDHVWGWLAYRIPLGDLKFDEDPRAYPMFDIEAGIASGRFAPADSNLIYDCFAGILMMAVKAVILGERPAGYAEQCAYMLMRALGLDAEDAQRVSQRELPSIEFDRTGT